MEYKEGARIGNNLLNQGYWSAMDAGGDLSHGMTGPRVAERDKSVLLIQSEKPLLHSFLEHLPKVTKKEEKKIS